MTTENEDTQYHLQYTSLVEIRSSILSLTFEIKESRAIPQDVSIDDHSLILRRAPQPVFVSIP